MMVTIETAVLRHRCSLAGEVQALVWKGYSAVAVERVVKELALMVEVVVMVVVAAVAVVSKRSLTAGLMTPLEISAKNPHTSE